MASYSSDRRSVLKIFGAIGATCAYPFAGEELFGQSAPIHQHTANATAHARFLNDADFQAISQIAELIIPETDTPGAIKAGVPEYIDMVISRDADQQSLVADGLRWLDRQHFSQLNENQKLALLEPLCEAADSGRTQGRNVQFFALIKKLTADGYYTSKPGLMEDLGYKGNTVHESYPGCVHEH
jgi:hypothetical protein